MENFITGLGYLKTSVLCTNTYACARKLSVHHLGYAKVKVFNLRQVNPLLFVILSKYLYVINKSILSKNTKIMQSVFRKEKPVTFIVQNIGM